MTRWVVFDYGNVISEANANLDRLAAMLDSPPERFANPYWAFRNAYDHGASEVEYWQSVGRELDRRVSAEQALELTAVDTAGWLVTSPAALALIGELAAADVPLALLSNAPSSFGRIVAEQPWTEPFRHLVFSGDLGVIKPAPAIWTALADRLGTRDCVFFDDREENTDGATEAGLIGIHWRGAAHARDQLVALGVLPA
ncbi:HAD-IA family hydrolase [Actinosynnema sp. NPDC047251]|uniref:HAD-superfamily hydrolase, subfamily IA, variant 3 n=1 Tax=Saccharothrix espanaensis (strain ATCC 51144 / DSM 44229 / JCM 9112 / NBRC 15066 / NRRL 15764) TaxID=1179773 RepID=K0KFE0_SACES|nr:HAD-IA family hydrolase [Saccharothrix espanaensis]CCH35489.1 HAD-superfamily hydrolase, subfamily IA, variant 3 [Saccharothrix espanaensis DSM 44229]